MGLSESKPNGCVLGSTNELVLVHVLASSEVRVRFGEIGPMSCVLASICFVKSVVCEAVAMGVGSGSV